LNEGAISHDIRRQATALRAIVVAIRHLELEVPIRSTQAAWASRVTSIPLKRIVSNLSTTKAKQFTTISRGSLFNLDRRLLSTERDWFVFSRTT
jgi:hypothetical protein